ncbi:hypothetical protein LS684_22630 (plasmid) [Cytobacillus spongiae]|uniref:hypothetical protein n=1 Tax=Cytobacillus spongiae TaxID=2901381 RepID=UPI00145D7ADB|nr:hypothetical protein [Cytobacillus spongiae]NMH70119.1 hypothetical protein [Bacillus sp. RO3]UII58401.1 hypothetical protein LS684_22630 [Cytobacillus spongiae]
MNSNYHDCNCHKSNGYKHDDHRDHHQVDTCDCCVIGLEKTIREQFRCGDTIGITRLGDVSAGIFVGRFRGLKYSVLEIDDLLVPGTTSFIPLCDIESVEKGIQFQYQPMKIEKK